MGEVEKAQEVQPRRRPFGGWLEPWFADWLDWFEWPRIERLFGDVSHALRVEEFTEGNEAVVRVEIPGIDPDKDVDITVSDSMLNIRAERREEKKTEEKGRYHSEFRYGSFSRTVSLPPGVTEKDVKATYKDGILEVRMPIDTASAEARKIPIQRA